MVDVPEGVADSHLLGAVGVLLLALHLDADDLDGLVPSRKTTTKGGGENLLPRGQLLSLLLASGLADTLLSKARETETGTPVGHLANGNGVDALVDTADTLAAVDVHEGGPSAGGLLAGGAHLVLGNLDRLHTGAEAHGGIRLRNTANDTTGDTGNEVTGTGGTSTIFGLRGNEEKHGTLGGALNPGPWDKTLVD